MMVTPCASNYDDDMLVTENRKRKFREDTERTACINLRDLQSVLYNLRAAKYSMDLHGLTFQEVMPSYSQFIREHYLSNKKIQELCEYYECDYYECDYYECQ